MRILKKIEIEIKISKFHLFRRYYSNFHVTFNTTHSHFPVSVVNRQHFCGVPSQVMGDPNHPFPSRPLIGQFGINFYSDWLILSNYFPLMVARPGWDPLAQKIGNSKTNFSATQVLCSSFQALIANIDLLSRGQVKMPRLQSLIEKSSNIKIHAEHSC